MKHDYQDIYNRIPPEGISKAELARLVGYRGGCCESILAIMEHHGLLLSEDSSSRIFKFEVEEEWTN